MSGEILKGVPKNFNFQDAYDGHNGNDGFGIGPADGTSILVCSQSGITAANIAEIMDLDPVNIHLMRAPASAVLPGVVEEAEQTLTGKVDTAFTHPNCRGATLLDGKDHPDTRATRAIKNLSGKIGAHFGGDLPLTGNRSNVLYVVDSSQDVQDFEPTRVSSLPDGYVVHAHVGQDSALRINTQVLLDVIGGFFPDSTTHLVGITNGRRGANRQITETLGRLADGKPNVKVSPLVVRRG